MANREHKSPYYDLRSISHSISMIYLCGLSPFFTSHPKRPWNSSRAIHLSQCAATSRRRWENTLWIDHFFRKQYQKAGMFCWWEKNVCEYLKQSDFLLESTWQMVCVKIHPWWENTSIDLIVLSYRLCLRGKKCWKADRVRVNQKQSSIFMFAIV